MNRKHPFLPFVVVVFIFAASKFYFLNIIGIRLESIFTLILTSILFTLSRLNNFNKYFLKKDIFLIYLYFNLLYWFFNGNYEYLALMFAAAVFSAWVLAAPNQSLDKTIKIFVIFSGSFSFLVIFQALILIFNPTLFHNVNYSPLGSLTSSMGDMKINSGLHYLGFWASGAVKVLGVSLMRFQSFASEPSILVTIFLIPGFLGLMYNGIYKKLGYLILFFSCILASAGTVYLALAFGATVYALSVFFGKVMTRNKDELIFYILIGISIAFLVLSIGFDIYKTTSLLDRGLRGYSEYSSILQYAGNKAEHRVFSSQEAFSLLINNPFGVGKASGISVVGIILDFGLKLGWFGVLISLLIFIPLIKRLIGQMSLPSTNKLAYAFLIGILIQALVFSGYGFSNPGGYVVIAILISLSKNQITYI